MPPQSRGLHVIPVADDRLMLKRGIREISIGASEARQIVGPLLELLDGTREIDEAVAMLPGSHQPTARRIADALLARRLLDGDSDLSVATPGVDTLQSAFYANFGAAGRNAADALRDAHVVVHGSGLIAASLVHGLGELSVGRLTAIADAGLANPFLASAGALAAPSATHETPIDRRADPLADLGGVDLLAAAADLGQEDGLLAVGRRALAAGIPFLPAWLSDMVGFVGPLTYPYETACLRCYQLRVDANVADPTIRRAMREHTAQDPAAAASTGLLPPMAAIVGQIAAVEVAKTVGGFAPPDAVSRSIEINLVSFRSTVRRVLKLPRCPDCGEVSRHATRVKLTGPQITE